MISIYQSKDHRWRDSFNPLRGLSMPRLVSLLEAGDGGLAGSKIFYRLQRAYGVPKWRSGVRTAGVTAFWNVWGRWRQKRTAKCVSYCVSFAALNFNVFHSVSAMQ